MTVYDAVGVVVWAQVLVLMAALGFAAFELAFAAMGGRRHFLTRRRLSLAACASVFAVLAILPVISPWASAFNVTDAVLAQYLKGNLAVMSAQEMQSIIEMPKQVVEKLASGTSWPALLVFSVFAGAFILRTGYLALNIGRIRTAMKKGLVLRETRRLNIIVSPSVTVPFSTRGLFRYVVVLPVSVCGDPGALRMYLGHEVQHIRQGDVDAEILMSIVSPFFVLNPAYWFIAGRVRGLAELACDRAFLAKERMGARDYSLRLLTIAQSHMEATRPAPRAFGVPLIGRSLLWVHRDNQLKSRIQEIAADVDAAPREGSVLAVVASAALMAVIFGVAIAFGASGDWSHERIMLSTVVNLERINELNTLAQRSW